MIRALDDFFLQLEGETPNRSRSSANPLGYILADLVHGSLFSGAGGFELGAEGAGIDTAWSCEIEEDCRELLKVLFPGTIVYNDIKRLHNPPYVDIISGGFPCQDISCANVSNEKVYSSKGKFKGISGERSGLWKEMYRVVKQVRPKYAIIENSPLLTKRGLEVIIQDLTKIGYCLEWQTLSASMLGYPHYRKRFYGIAYPIQDGCARTHEVYPIFQELLSVEASGQALLPRNFKRYGAGSDYSAVRIHDGLSNGLDEGQKRAIEMMGNAVIPKLTELIFRAIKIHHESVKL